MFGKTKRKIVFTVAFSLIALMTVTLATIYISNRIALDRDNREMLKTFAERYTLEEQGERQDGDQRPDDAPEPKPGDRNEPPDDRRGKNERAFRLSTFYSVAYSKDGEVLAVNGGELQSRESVLERAASIMKTGRTSGKSGNMTYLVEEREDFTLVAMIDGTINDDHQTRLFYQMLIIGAAATAVLFVLSIFLARAIVRPLEENDKRQKRFVSDAGHELKTPIAVISANGELLRRQIGENEWLDNIDYENEKMSALVKQLLDLSHAERGDLPMQTLDFSTLVSGETLPFESLAFEKGRPVVSTVEEGLTVKGNANQLRQLVSILLDNALSHGTGGEIELALKKEKHSALLTVSNEATDLDAKQIPHLFDRFYRADEAREDNEGHYGLGLSIAKAVVSAHGGSITADCKDGRAVFTVALPLQKK